MCGYVATYSVEGNAVFLQDGGRYQCHLVAKEGVAALAAARKKACRGRQCEHGIERISFKSRKWNQGEKLKLSFE